VVRWLLLIYKVPRQPTSKRVYVWRKLRRLGAMSLQDAVWVLPMTPQTREQLQWLAAEIDELDGEATLWQSSSVLGAQEERLVRQFVAKTDAGYRQIAAALRRRKPNAAVLSRRYQQVLARDYFHSELGKRVRAMLLNLTGVSDA